MATTATPYLTIRGAAKALEFYAKAFGAEETLRLTMPDGSVAHGEISIGGAAVYLAEEAPDHGARSPEFYGGTPVPVHLYVDDVDAFVARAVDAGATIIRPVEDQFYGDRSGKISDPFGHVWLVSTVKETLSAEEMQRRFDELMRGQ